jgi:hypothetical protein
MSQNFLMPNTVSAKKCFWNLRQYVHIGLQWLRFQCFPWLVLAIAPLKLLFASEVERIHEQVRYLNAIARIDFVGVYGLLNDLLW